MLPRLSRSWAKEILSLGVLETALVEDQSSVSNIHVRRFTVTYNSSSGGISSALLWPPWIIALMCACPTSRTTYTYT